MPPPDGVATLAPADLKLRFERIVLDDRFLCEGASFGDLDGDGVHDVVAGPWWYAGPDFTESFPLHGETVFDPLHYSDHFFSWVHDFDRDGRNDVLVVGFPGKEASWYRNSGNFDAAWERHIVFDGVDNESPAFTDLTGDGVPDLVCMHGGRLGWLDWDPDAPSQPWTFHPATADGQGGKFQHGLGVGDLDGDGRADLLLQRGWWKQPESLAGDPEWAFTPQAFGPDYGGAQMLVADFDGDGDADVVSSLAAHGWGLSWFEQHPGIVGPAFEEHPILAAPAEGADPGANVSELHALALADFDGDGVPDFVTGKRWWSHGPDAKPDARGPAMVHVFLARRGANGLRWEMQRVDGDSGVGVQVTAGDVDGDGRADVVVANKQGASVFLQQEPVPLPTGPDFGFETGTLHGWTAEGEAFRGQPVRGDTVNARLPDWRSAHVGEYWIGGYELAQDGPTGTLTSDPFRCAAPWASFLVGGGRAESTRVEILRDVDGQVLYSCSGPNYETMQRVAFDLSGVLGQDLRIRLVDDNPGGWGHINFDDFRFHETQPEIAAPTRVPRVHPYPTLQTTGLEPEAAAAAMTVPEGFRVDLIAGEPDLHQPVALATDTSGRLWVAEAHSYPSKRGPGKGLDKILVFEDRDLDGSFETRTVFAEGLDLVSGLAVGFGGVWIGAAPEMLFIPDADRDLVPDGPPVVMLDGFGYQDTHETLNSFIWGPDGWLYGCHGVFTHSRVGKPGTPDVERVGLNAGVWRMHPVTLDFEVFAYGTSNPWGIDFDERGQAVVTACVIPHLWHMVQGGRYQRQGGSHFDKYAYTEIGTIGDHLHYAGNVGDHAWWGRDRSVADPGTDLAGGGHAHCGALIYLESQFPEEYRGSVLMNNIHGNRINRDLLERSGSGLIGRHGPDFVRANDQWYRGVAMRAGPDGSVYFIDWYDKNACHRNDRELWDRTNGRLYRVSYGDPQPVAVGLHAKSDLELVEVLRTGDEWWARAARLVLQERAAGYSERSRAGIDPRAEEALRTMILDHPDPSRRLHALWALHATRGVDDKTARSLLRSEHPWIRTWTVQFLLEDGAVSDELHGMLQAMALSETAPQFQLALASAMQRMPIARRWSLATVLTGWESHAEDANLPTVLWYGIEPLVGADPDRALLLAAQCRIPQLARWIWRRMASGSDAERYKLVEALRDAADPHAILAEMARALRDRPGTGAPPNWQQRAAPLLGSDDSRLREAAAEVALAFGDTELAPLFRARMADPELEVAKRREALEGLVRLGDPETGALLIAALNVNGGGDDALRGDALRGLAALPTEGAADAILAVLPRCDLGERELALQTLCARSDYATRFLAVVASGDAPRSLLDSVVVRRQLLALQDPDVAAALDRAWGRSAPPDSEAAAEIARLKKQFSPAVLAAGDPSNGRTLFARTCQACHVLHGIGGILGPDLTGSNRADLDYLLANLVAPSAEVGNDYRMTTVRMRDGRVMVGNVVREDDRTLVLRTGAGEETLLKSGMRAMADGSPAIERLAVSLMPPGQLQALSAVDARDLVAYLQQPAQVPMRATPATVGSFFNGRDLNFWQGDPAVWSVVDGEIFGRTTTGLEHNSFLASELLLRDFRLVIDVRLRRDEGNSGVQFRSTTLDGGEMRGLQADVGPGWWGKLYEEQGRGLLVDEEAKLVREGTWNTYEIVAVGDRTLIALNGRALIDRTDPEAAREGVVGLQVHSGGPTEVRFRIVRLELDPEPVLQTAR